MKIISTRKIKARNPNTGEFEGVNAFAAESTKEYLDKIAKKGRETLDSIPEDYTELTVEVGQMSEDIDTKLDRYKYSVNRLSADGEQIGVALNVETGDTYENEYTSSFRVSKYCDVLSQNPYGTITVRGLDTPRICFYNAYKNFISGINNDEIVYTTLTLPEGTKYVRVQSKGDFANAYINIGDDKNYHEPGKTDVVVPTKMSELEDDVSNWYGRAWVSYGDSITAQGNNGGGYQQYVDDMLGFDVSYRRGVGGQTYKANTSTFYANSDGSYAGRYGSEGLTEAPEGTTTHLGYFASWDRITTMIPENIRRNIDLVILCGGTNDHSTVEDVETDGVISAGVPKWIVGSTFDAQWSASSCYAGGDYDVNTFAGAIASTITKMRIWCPNAVVALATPYPRWNTETKEQYTNTKGLDAREMCEIQIATAKYMGCPVIDANAMCGIGGVNFAETVLDGVHPNNTGLKMYGKALADGLNTISPKIL